MRRLRYRVPMSLDNISLNVLCLSYLVISYVKGMEQQHKKGFAVMNRDKRRKIARLGGIASHQSGKCHEWNSEEARIAGRKGARARRKTSKA
jgi:general stress protein YciG